MATSPASAGSPGVPGNGRADSASPGRRISPWVIRVLLLAVASFALATPAFAATQATQATHATQAAQAAHQAQAGQQAQAGHHTRSVHNDRTGRVAATPATLTANLTPAAPGGACQVPGIGDIGGLIGLCNQGSSGILGAANNICQPSLPQPEQATGGLNAMVQPPGAAAGGKTLYDNYGVAGQFWAAHGLQCSDMTSLIGNNVAGMVFDGAKSLDRVTITVYQSAAGEQHPDLAAGRGGPADQRAGQRHLLPLPGARHHPGRDLAGLAGADPQAGHPDHRGHPVDGGGVRGRHRADRQAGRVHRDRTTVSNGSPPCSTPRSPSCPPRPGATACRCRTATRRARPATSPTPR